MNKNIITSVMVAGILLVGGSTMHTISSNHSQVVADTAAVKSADQQVDKYKKMKQDLTKKDVAKNLSHTKNIDKIKGDATNRINNSFNVAYTNMTSDKYNDDRKKIEQQLGQSAGDTLATVAQPQEKVYSDSINNMKIGFGRYDEINETIPVLVTVNFKANDRTTLNDQWTMTYHTDTKTFSGMSHTSIPNNNSTTANINNNSQQHN